MFPVLRLPPAGGRLAIGRPGAWLPKALLVLLSLGGLGSSCCSCTPAPDFTVRRGAALSPAPAPPPIAGGVTILHAGDFGMETCQQGAMASAIEEAQRRSPFDLALFAGDNLYYCGPTAGVPGAEACEFAADNATVASPPSGPPDPLFATLHEGPLGGLAASPRPPRTLLILGNHDVAVSGDRCTDEGLGPDVAARRKACLEVAHRSPLWEMPGRHWVLDQANLRLIAIDTNVVTADYGGFTLDEEVAFVAGAAAGCDTRSCFIVGHAPPATAGLHWQDPPADRADRMQRLIDAAGPHLRGWLAGHEHDLQHVRTPAGLDVLVSGAGCFSDFDKHYGNPSPGAELLFASASWGYGILTVGDGGWQYRFEDHRGRALYCCAAAGAGRCLPTGCW